MVEEGPGLQSQLLLSCKASVHVPPLGLPSVRPFVSVAPEPCWPMIEDWRGPGCSVTEPPPCPRLAKSWSALSVGRGGLLLSQPNCSTPAPGMGDLPAPITSPGAELRPPASCLGRLRSSWGPKTGPPHTNDLWQLSLGQGRTQGCPRDGHPNSPAEDTQHIDFRLTLIRSSLPSSCCSLAIRPWPSYSAGLQFPQLQGGD